eukprot:2384566-Alexandrium_andersonii.AAC.1
MAKHREARRLLSQQARMGNSPCPDFGIGGAKRGAWCGEPQPQGPGLPPVPNPAQGHFALLYMK